MGRIPYSAAEPCRTTHPGRATIPVRAWLPDAQITVGTDIPRSLSLMHNDRLVNELGFQARWTMETGMVAYLNRVRENAGLTPVAAPA